MDCFYVAVERTFDASLMNKACAVVQYNPFEKGGVTTKLAHECRIIEHDHGSIIAVSYEARARGVTRQMRGIVHVSHTPHLSS